jgi:putative sigma-54 modulation protein
MDINVITRHLARTPALIDHAQRRASFAFARFGAMIRGIEIRVSDVNGPRGGAGIACLARLQLTTGGDVLVESTATSPEDGVSKSIARLAKRIRRMSARHQDHC